MSDEPDVIVVTAEENLTAVDVVASDPVMAVDVTTGPAVEVVEVNTGLQGPVGPPGPPGQADEVWIGDAEPSTGQYELWYSPNEGEAAPGEMQIWHWQGPEMQTLAVGEESLGQGEVATDTIPSQASMLYLSAIDSTGMIDWTYKISPLKRGDSVYLQHSMESNSWHRYRVTDTPLTVKPLAEPSVNPLWSIPVQTADGSPPGTAPAVGEPVLIDFVPETSGHGYVHTQNEPTDTWLIPNPLGYAPNVTIIDSAGSQVEGDVVYGPDFITASFSAAFAGTAILS